MILVVLAIGSTSVSFFPKRIRPLLPSISTALCDLECGSSYETLVEAVKQGKIDEKAVDVAVKRL